uniref:Ig-like domain-containing protein n=1 Tax=Mola mola TaxID=94237 RepID=A0A3Q3X9B2_MOLML
MWLAHSKKVLGSIPGQGVSVWSFACSPCVCVGSLQVLRLPPTVQKHVVLLDCDVGEGDSQWVQWYRQNPSGEYELIFDTNDETVAIPQDLRDRLTPSENGFSLTISNLEVRDIGGYWCVVSEGPQFLEEHEYTDDYGGEDEHSGDVMFQFLQDTHRCLSKREIILSLINKTRRDLDFEPSVNIINEISQEILFSQVVTWNLLHSLELFDLTLNVMIIFSLFHTPTHRSTSPTSAAVEVTADGC